MSGSSAMRAKGVLVRKSGRALVGLPGAWRDDDRACGDHVATACEGSGNRTSEDKEAEGRRAAHVDGQDQVRCQREQDETQESNVLSSAASRGVLLRASSHLSSSAVEWGLRIKDP
jgi:hypothetical protein